MGKWNKRIRRTSVVGYLKKYIMILLLGYLLSIIVNGLVVIEAYYYTNLYEEIRSSFNNINDVITGKADPHSLLPIMEKSGFNYKRYKELLKKFDETFITKEENNILNEEIRNEIRNFANFLRNYETGYLNTHRKQIRSIFVLLFFLLAFGLILVRNKFNYANHYLRKTTEKIEEISSKVYVNEIEAIEVKFKEDEILNKAINKINTILKINNTIRHMPINTTIEEFIDTIGPLLCSYFRSERFSIAFIDWETETIIAETAYKTFDHDKIKLGPGFFQKFTETSLGEMIKNNETIRIINNFSERYEKTKSVSLKLLMEEGFNSNITLLASINSRPFGFLFLSSTNLDNYTEEDAELFLSIANIISYRLFYSMTLQKILSEFGNSLLNIVEFKDNETGNHIRRVASYSKAIAQGLNLTPKMVREIYEFAPIHDIGKVGIPENILLKPGKLSSDEWEVMKTHVTIGVTVIENFEKQVKNIIQLSTLEVIKNIIADHHEWWNGKGYPQGKKGEEISIEGRIVAISDVFDALTTKRPYKEAIPFEKAVEMIKEESGTHFDPKIVEIFLSKIEEIREIYEKLKD